MFKRLAIAVAVLALPAAAPAKKASLRSVIDRYFEIVDGKKFDRYDEVDTADLVMKTPMGTLKGAEGHVQLSKGFAAAFPNYKHTVTSCVESADTIACEGIFTGDHTGPMMMPSGQTVPPTQKHVEFPWSGVARVQGGKVAEMHVYFDNMGFMQQLGLLPAPGAATVKK